MESRGQSACTVKGRTLVVQRLARWLEDVGAADATTEQVEAFLEARRADVGRRRDFTTVSPNTIRNELAHLRSWFLWLRKQGHRHDDPTWRIDVPRLVKAAIPPADDQSISHALEQADDGDRAILALSAFAGLRAGEIAGLQWRDVDLDRGTIVVRHGKGDKARTVGMSEPVRVALTGLPRTGDPVIRRRDGQPRPNLAGQISKRATALLGGRAGGFTLHQLRHRFATAAYAGTRDLRAVQDALGHSSPITTALYAHTRGEDLQAAAVAASRLVTVAGRSTEPLRLSRRLVPQVPVEPLT